ncbi:MAG: enolase C-terminal domain-like protein [Planctomycetota bacterium]|nr:enolase C-terminal domain-like protein [Planctomycetota bacterium]
MPYRFQYGHAAHQHRGLRAVVCVARDESGRVGLGEAVPRTYVTGETCQSILADAEWLIAALDWSVPDRDQQLAQRLAMVQSHAGPFPSCALCALDTAATDLWAQQVEQPLARWCGAESLDPLTYSASIGMSGTRKMKALMWLYRRLGIRHFKLKVGDELDEQRLRLFRRKMGSEARVFVDANGAWDRATAIRKIEMFQKWDVWAVEEPLRWRNAAPAQSGQVNRLAIMDDRHYEAYAWLRNRVSIPLIADESLICTTTLGRILQFGAFDILNLRLSKCGGPLLTAHMARTGVRNELQFALGAMVGETPILATAGAHFAAANREHLYVQGYSHRLLHARSFVTNAPRFRRSQVSFAAPLESGAGLHLDFQKLDAITQTKKRILSR